MVQEWYSGLFRIAEIVSRLGSLRGRKGTVCGHFGPIPRSSWSHSDGYASRTIPESFSDWTAPHLIHFYRNEERTIQVIQALDR
jgi:hypothetical protein